MKDYCPSSLPLDTRIAGDKNVSNWISLRAALIDHPGDKKKWEEAYDFFRLRIDTRFIKPIETILSINENLGEGHAASVLQCVLLEFFEALFQGKVYRQVQDIDTITKMAADLRVPLDLFKKHIQPHEYSSSVKLFKSFLTTRLPFAKVFTKKAHAYTFYNDIRCGLLHEAATKSSSKILAKKEHDPTCLMEPINNGLVIYRNAFQKGLLASVQDYHIKLLTDTDIQKNYIRKMDDIAQIERCFYFAYGSNLKASHLLSRIKYIHGAYKAYLDGYEFHYNKKSDDGTAKANISRCDNNCRVYGVCYEIDDSDFKCLHENHEKGYNWIPVWTEGETTGPIIAKTFISESITTSQPSSDYVCIVVEGAREQWLPVDYIRKYLEKK